MLLLAKMASKSSTGVAVQYERMLIQHIRNMKGTVDMDALIAEVVPTVETAVNVHFSRLARGKEAPPIERQPHAPMSRASGQQGKASGAQTGASSATKGKKTVCIFHDPSQKKTCKLGDKCNFEHANT